MMDALPQDQGVHEAEKKLHAQRNLAMEQMVQELKQRAHPETYFEVHGKQVPLGSNSLYFLDAHSRVRWAAVWLIEWVWFERFIVGIILTNTILLTLQDYSFRMNEGEEAPAKGPKEVIIVFYMRQSAFEALEYVFTTIFILEFVLKVVGMGFILEPNTYLRDGWNVIDFAVVVTSFMGFFSDMNLSALRTIRILRPLRSINSVQGMKILVASLLDALPDLGNVVIFLLFIVILFGILGLSLFMGVTENRCRLTPKPVNGAWLAGTYAKLCPIGDDSGCPAGLYCGNPFDYGLPPQENIESVPGLNFGYTTFDHIGQATFTIFQALTTEGWTQLIYMYADTVTPGLVYVYFVLLIFVGSFFIVNLILAVINDSFTRANEKKIQTVRLGHRTKKKTTLLARTNQVAPEPIQSNDQGEDSPEKKTQEEQVQLIHIFDSLNSNIQQLRSPQLEQQQSETQFQKFQQKLTLIIESKYFLGTLTVIILLNTLTLALDRYPQDPVEKDVLDIANIVFTLIFTLEMLLKLTAYGFRTYFRDQLNIFDTFIVILSLVDLILTSVQSDVDTSALTALKAFRTFRLFRMFKLARSWVKLRQLLAAIIATVAAISNFVVLLLLFMIIASLLGMELFAYRVRENGASPRYNFDDFPNAMITIFILLTNENWNTITYQYMKGLEQRWPMFYFVIVVIIGNFILLKLFIAILINNFSSSNEQVEKENQQNQQSESSQHDAIKPQPEQLIAQNEINRRQTSFQISNSQPYHRRQSSFQFSKDNSKGQSIIPSRVVSKQPSEAPSPKSAQEMQVEDEQPQQQPQLRASMTMRGSITDKRKQRKMIYNESERKEQTVHQLEGKTLFLLDPENPVRKICLRTVSSKYFDMMIFALIIISSILLAIDDPLQEYTGPEEEALYSIDVIITSIFILESGMKIITFGLVLNGPKSYLRNLSNVLDLVVIVFSAFRFNRSSATNFSQVKILRVLRVLRPLRMISRNEGLKISINALMASMQQILNLMLVCFIFFLLFGILGVNQLKGAFYHCVQHGTALAIQDKWECMDYGGSWVNEDYNFDNILNGIVTLFVIATTEGWVDLMSVGTDSRGIDLNPQPESQKWWCLYYIGFVIVGAFFVMNLFAGVMVDAFTTEKQKLGGLHQLGKDQLDWVNIQFRIYKSKPAIYLDIPKNSPIRKRIHKFTQSQPFEIFIFVLIILNTILLMAVFWRAPNEVTLAFQVANWCFLGVFALEAVLKIIAQQQKYFMQGWNLFDFIVILLTFLGISLEQTNTMSSFGTSTSVLRSFRIFRVLRLVKSAHSLRVMFQTFIVTLPTLTSIGALLALILFMFAVLGMNLYPFIRRNDMGITDDANFSSFLTSFFTLFRISTGEGWDILQADVSRPLQPHLVCLDILDLDAFHAHGFMDCGSWTGYLFFIAFQVLFSLVMLNLFVAIIIEGFQKTNQDENSKIRPLDVENFIAQWKLYDKSASGFIKIKYLQQLLIGMPPPFGWSGLKKSPIQQRVAVIQAEIPIYILQSGEYVYYFYEVMRILAEEYLWENFSFEEQQFEGHIMTQLQNLMKDITKALQNVRITDLTSAHATAAIILQRNFRYRKTQLQQDLKKIDDFGTQQDESDHLVQEGIQPGQRTVTFR